MTTNFETHPIGTGKRLAELEGLAFARRRTVPTTDEDAEAARAAYHAPVCPWPSWGNLDEVFRVPWRRVAEAVRDRLSGREMVASPTYEEGYEAGRRDEAQARAAVRDEGVEAARDAFYEDERISAWEAIAAHPFFTPCYATAAPLLFSMLDRLDGLAAQPAPQPIDPADVRVGDRVSVVTEGVVKDIDAFGWVMDPDSCAGGAVWLLDRPDPDAKLVEGVATAIAASLSGTEDSWRSEARAALAKIREAHTIEPRPTKGDLRA